MKTVFFNNCSIYLVTDKSYSTAQHFYAIQTIDIPTLIEQIEQDSIKKVYLYDTNFDNLWQHFSGHFKCIEAGGGKVLNELGEVLFIYRNDTWDLPKGKIEKGESTEEAAIREVEEETGIENLTIEKPLDTTYHMYKYKEKYVLKISYWFQMTSDFKGELLSQLEEGITKVEWLSDVDTEAALKNTYENIKLLF